MRGSGRIGVADRAAAASAVEPASRLQQSQHPLRVLSLFAGIGGFDLGLERTGGFKTVAFCEIDPRARKVLACHWPKVPIYDDVRELSAARLAGDGITADAIVGGFPCQDISAAGDRAGLVGERSGLWFEMARLVGELRPRFVIVENVAELLANGFGDVLGSLASIGYDAEWDCIPAASVGAPHLRDRVWVIAHPSEEPGLYESDAWEAAKRLLDEPTYWQANPWRSSDAAICRVDDGPPERVDRTEECGNAVVPQIPELIGRAILAAIAIEAQRAVTTKIGTVRSTKARAEGIARNVAHPISRTT